MGWETHGNRRYFYRSVRIDGRTHRVYLSYGAAAEQAAAEVRARRRREERRQRLCALSEAHADLTAPLDALDGATDLLARASFVTSGFHEHHRMWRRRRGRLVEPGADEATSPALVDGEPAHDVWRESPHRGAGQGMIPVPDTDPTSSDRPRKDGDSSCMALSGATDTSPRTREPSTTWAPA